MPARGPLKKTLPLIIDWAVLAWTKNELCFSYKPTSRDVHDVTVVYLGCSPSVPSTPALG
jgi:hypothetical protein